MSQEYADVVQSIVAALCGIAVVGKGLFLWKLLEILRSKVTDRMLGVDVGTVLLHHIGVAMILVSVLVGQWYALHLHVFPTPASLALVPALVIYSFAVFRLSRLLDKQMYPDEEHDSVD